MLKRSGGELLYSSVESHIVSWALVLNSTFFMPSASAGMLHKTAGKRRGHQPPAVWNLAQELPGMRSHSQAQELFAWVSGSSQYCWKLLNTDSRFLFIEMKQSHAYNSEKVPWDPGPFFLLLCQDLLLCNSNPETFTMQNVEVVFTQGLQITVEGVTNNSKIPKQQSDPLLSAEVSLQQIFSTYGWALCQSRSVQEGICQVELEV